MTLVAVSFGEHFNDNSFHVLLMMLSVSFQEAKAQIMALAVGPEELMDKVALRTIAGKDVYINKGFTQDDVMNTVNLICGTY